MVDVVVLAFLGLPFSLGFYLGVLALLDWGSRLPSHFLIFMFYIWSLSVLNHLFCASAITAS